ncbi:MAG: phasin family protein [Salinibacter sp.]|uniref:phasin family protein n=1 Tax=Salinibacter sp. TaxID=2065818 RepID=UPI0035D524CD
MAATNNEKPSSERKGFSLQNFPDEVSGRAREVWLAGLGALERLEEEGDRVFETLVERGKQYQETRRDQIEEATENLREQQEALVEDVTQRLDDATASVDKAVSDTLRRIGVPTRKEVRDLSRRVRELSEKLEALSEKMLEERRAAATEERVLHVVPNDEGWVVTIEGDEEYASSHDTKKEAVSAARDTAREHAPSQLVVHKQDRSVQESFSYDAGDE